MKFKFSNNTYFKDIKSDWIDKLDIEIGDSKQPELFYPQIKVKRWDNEVNFSIRLKDDDYNTAQTVYKDDDKIEWKNDKREVHFYDIERADNHLFEDGGYEINVVLLEKPDTNVIEFSIETKDVEFYYQPALTQEQKDAKILPEGRSIWEQLDCAIGSYAVYHRSPPDNIIDEKLYRCGKVAHIFRPKIVDNSGNWIWGELNVDTQKKLLTVTISQDFLDTAIYPVFHAAGFQMGFTGVGVGGTTSIEDVIAGSFFASNGGGTCASITLYSNPSKTLQTYACNIYLHSTLVPIANGDTGVLTPGATGAAWRIFDYVTEPTCVASTEYVLCGFGLKNTGTHLMYYDANAANTGHVDTGGTFSTWTNPMSPAHSTNKYSIYVSSVQGSSSSSSRSSSSSSSRSSSSSSSSRSSFSSSSSESFLNRLKVASEQTRLLTSPMLDWFGEY